jgi:5-(carboxyamino)imidazole ribonucleotide synthase
LHTTQHRLREKTFLSEHGFPVTPFRAIRTAEELRAAIRELKLPAVLKTAAFGYDGKGQAKLSSNADVDAAATRLQGQDHVYEAFVDFELEVSVVGARGSDGSFAHWGVIENRHANHILDLSIAPADVPAAVEKDAVEIARGIFEQLDVIGVMCVEFFLTRAGKLTVNELAPRPHNSGHLTIDASITSQFEQQLRAVCGLPLGDTRLHRPAAMAQILGDLWKGGEPNWAAALQEPGVKLHLYGKSDPRAGRKMGHLTATGNTHTEALRDVELARKRLLIFK